MKDISHYILQLSIWSVGVPFIVGLLFYTRLNYSSKIIFYLVVCALVPQILTAFIPQHDFLNTVYNIYTPVEFALVYFFIGNKLKLRTSKMVAHFFVALFVFISVLLIIKFGVTHRFLNEWVCAANISYLCWIFLYLLESFIKEEHLIDAKSSMFWYLSALIIYTPCALIFALYYSIAQSGKPSIISLWAIQGIFNTTLYFFFAIGFYKNQQESKIISAPNE